MGGLAHYIEDEGIPTTQISLIREHTEKMRPPRALWVPFELGRPIGSPDAPDFQRQVVRALLALLEAESGPLIEDFPEDAPEVGMIEGWACPVNLPPPPSDDSDLQVQLAEELSQLRPWHDLWIENRGRTTVGASALEIEPAARFMAAFLDEAEPEMPREGLSSSELLKLVLEDVKAFYLEAALAQPGQSTSQAAADWFWGETTAGRIMLALHPVLAAHPDKAVRFVGASLLVPRSQQHRLAEKAPA
ncbi:MAG: hypothetical protein QF893_21340 [Alphaproteobacteria bacterium]|nr:hypothetical protein [Alphaproteobacteria bacterium]